MSVNRRSEYTYRPAWWVRGGHAQTLWGKFFRPRPRYPTRVERWTTPDGDFIELHRLDGMSLNAPRLFFLHGLEGTARSHYVVGFFGEAARRGWAADLLIFRGCGAEPNLAPRFYHSGDTGDLAFALDRVLRESPSSSPILLAGVSLGGNVLLKYLGERGKDLSSRRDLGALRSGTWRAIPVTRLLEDLRPTFPADAPPEGACQACTLSRPLRPRRIDKSPLDLRVR